MVQCGISSQGNPIYEYNPGDALYNLLPMMQKAEKICFICKVGHDMLGRMVKKRTEEQNIDMSSFRIW